MRGGDPTCAPCHPRDDTQSQRDAYLRALGEEEERNAAQQSMLEQMSTHGQQTYLDHLPEDEKAAAIARMSDALKAEYLAHLPQRQRAKLLKELPAGEKKASQLEMLLAMTNEERAVYLDSLGESPLFFSFLNHH